MQGTISEPQPSLDTEGHSMGGRDEALIPPGIDTTVVASSRPDRTKEREA